MKKNIIESYLNDETDISTGLNFIQIENRKLAGLSNKKKDPTSKSYFRIIFDNTFTFFNALLVSIAILYVIFIGASAIGNLSFILVATVNLLIGCVQECKAKHTIEKLKLVNASKAIVLREGNEIEIAQDDILLGDIIKLKAGDQIPVDCKIVKGMIEANESLLTGESDAIKKEIDSVLYAGSFVISGDCYALVTAVADKTYVYSIESKAKGFEAPKSELMKSISGIIKKLTCVVIPLGLLTFWNTLLNTNGKLSDAVNKGGTAMVGMIPPGMVLLASVAMAAGVIKLASHKTLVRNLYSVESLARIDTLCLDKTGTLTDGTMRLEETIKLSPLDINPIISSYLSAFESTNQTSLALEHHFGRERCFEIKNTIPFSSARKYSVVEFVNGETYILGAPEYLTKDEEVLNISKTRAADGLRTLILIKVDKEITEDFVLPETNEILAIFVIRDNIRPQVRNTMKWFTENDVEIRVISGDNIATVSYIAKQCGIPNSDKAVDLSLVPENELRETIIKNYIFGRVTPEQKALIVDVLHEEGRTVAITGDGVNDILAMKKSDCAVAMANGSPATKSVANVVLLDSNFDNMPKTVMEGRRVVNNIQRASTLFLMKVFFMMFLTTFCLFLGINLPIETSVLGVVNIFITGISSLLLSLEPSYTRISGNFTKNVFGKAIPAGFFMFLPVMFLIIVTFCRVGLDINAVNTELASKVSVMAFCITVAGFIIFFQVCRPFNKFRRILFGSILALCTFILLAFPDFFLQNSTVFWGGMLEKYSDYSDANAILFVFRDLLTNIFSFKLYTHFSITDWVIIISFSLFSFMLYYISDIIISRVLKINMFSAALFDEIQEKKEREKRQFFKKFRKR